MTSESSRIEEIHDESPDLDTIADDADSGDDDLDTAEPSQPSTSTSTVTATGTVTSSKKKKKKKSKAARALSKLIGQSDGVPQQLVDRVLEQAKLETNGSEEVTEESVRQVLHDLKVMDMVKGKAGLGGFNKKDMGEHKFWETQPVPQLGEGPPLGDGYIEPSKPREEVRQEPYPLPKDFEWTTIDIDDPNQIKEVYDLLSANYVEDDDASFRFQYSAEFLHWALRPPGFVKEWHLGVRVSGNKKLVAFISGVPITLQVRNNTIIASEINYLCVHKRLRSKRLAPVLIKEVTRQVHLKGIFQAIYTGGVVLPTPIATCRYNHRPLNVPKLVDVKFLHVPRGMTMARLLVANKVRDVPALELREMEEKDVVKVTNLFAKYMKRFDMAPVMNADEVRHQFMSGGGTGQVSENTGRREGQVTWTYVAEDLNTHEVTDFISFYSLPSTIINNEKHGVLEAAYLYYYATDVAFQEDTEEEGRLKTRLLSLVGDAFHFAKKANFDVFNALTLMDNVSILPDLKFGVGDGYLNFYLYNWRTAPLAGMNAVGTTPAGKGVGVVML